MNPPETPSNGTSYHPFRVGDWNVEPAAGQIGRGGTWVKLEPKVMEILSYLASRQGELVTRDDLERDIWRGAIVGYNSITSAIIKLRRALADDARKPRYITTVPKRGYRLIAVVQDPTAGDDEVSVTEAGGVAFAEKSSRVTLSKLLVSAVFLVLVLVTALLFYQDKQAPIDNAPSTTSPPIVVLPFENLSGDPAEEYFADGMTDDNITDLYRLSGLLAFFASTSFTYKNRKVQPQTIATELNVDYVLDGSIPRDGDAIRVNAQLIDTKTGLQKRASRHDRHVVEVFAVQDDVIASIVNVLTVQLSNKEKKHLKHRNTDNLKDYELFQEGQRLSRIGSKETNEQAQAIYRQVIRMDPDYGRAYGALAYNLGRAYYSLGSYDDAIKSLNNALERNETAVPVRLFLASSYVQADGPDDAEWKIEQIGVLNPSATISQTRYTMPIQKPEQMESFLADLRSAGMAE
jgi:adenylate cyclase